ncbi:MAG TPA: glycosyltransferase family 2 protein [Candidatus Omnitrophota bacterium]|nr:glycosyltransferase family 2 protein [Candidatus Omnitrophota bacterium]HQO59209.1 glycosyltransferase family 2 protein [Candidatus Omnitrophota bacterium]HQP12722.1 glycosyltransferase family 2 protein [Candidatus Omnitrophota bacterium]
MKKESQDKKKGFAESRRSETVTLIIFSLNEIDGMKVIMPRIKPEWVDQLLIVDGGSGDGTLEYARQHGYNVFVQERKGAGAAFLEAVNRATGDIVIVFSPDGNSIPEKIPELIAKMKEGYDIVIVSRYRDGARSEDDDLVTAFGNWMFTRLINFCFGLRITDALVMYRAYRRDIVKKLGVSAEVVSWGTQILARAARKNARIGEIPGDEPPRIGGVRKMHPLKNGISELGMIFTEFFRRTA